MSEEYLIKDENTGEWKLIDHSVPLHTIRVESNASVAVQVSSNTLRFYECRVDVPRDANVVWQRGLEGEFIDGLTAFNMFANGENVQWICKIDGLWDGWNDWDEECQWSLAELKDEVNFKFRKAPKRMIKIGDIEIEAPENEPLNKHEQYYLAQPSIYDLEGISCGTKWVDDDLDRERLRRGLIHRTAENALAHTKALIALTELK